MRIGLQVSADRGRYATKVEKLQADARWADEAGLDTVWTPRSRRVRRHDRGHAARDGHDADRGRHRHRPPPAAPPRCAGPAGPRRTRPSAKAASPSASACRTTGSSRTCSGCPTSARRTTMRCYLDVLDQALAGPGMVDVRQRAVHHPQPPRHHRPRADAGPDRRARPGDAEARRRARRRHQPVAGRRAHHRARTSCRRITKAAESARAARPAHLAGVPVCLCRDDEIEAAVSARTARSARSWPRPTTCG